VALNTKIQIQSTGHSPHFQVRDDNPKVEGGDPAKPVYMQNKAVFYLSL
jgi:hypothetical protein